MNIPPEAELLWNDIESGLNDVFNNRNRTLKRYMELSAHVFNFSTMEHPNDMAKEISHRLKKFLYNKSTEALKNTNWKYGDDLLRSYLESFEKYKASIKTVLIIFGKLERTEIDYNPFLHHNVSQLYMEAWKEALLATPHLQRIVEAALDILKREKNGEAVNIGLVSNVVSSFEEVQIEDIGEKSEERDDTWEGVLLRLNKPKPVGTCVLI